MYCGLLVVRVVSECLKCFCFWVSSVGFEVSLNIVDMKFFGLVFFLSWWIRYVIVMLNLVGFIIGV